MRKIVHFASSLKSIWSNGFRVETKNPLRSRLSDSDQQFNDPKWGAEQLKRIGIFSYLSEDELAIVYGLGEIRTLNAHSHAIIEGDNTRGLFLLLTGTVSVYKTDPQTKTMLRLSYLEGGASFGELSLIEQESRSATVVSDSTCTVFFLDAKPFHDFLDQQGDAIKSRFFKGCAEDLAKRLRRQNSDYISAAQMLWKYGLRRESEKKNEP